MSVAVTTNAFITPISRNRRDFAKKPIYGRWTGQCTVTGDGSGGVADLLIYLGRRGEYAEKMVWTVSFISAYMSVFAATNWAASIAPYEIGSDGNIFQTDFTLTPGQVGAAGYLQAQLNTYNGFTDFHWRFPDLGTTRAYVSVQNPTNVNLTFYSLRAGGYILHEELI